MTGEQTPAVNMFAGDAASRRDSITITAFETDAAEGRMTVTADMLNGHGTCHGGQIFLFADTVFSCACNGRRHAVAHKADILYVRAARLGDVLFARATEQASYGRNGVYDVVVTREDGELIALFRGHSRALPPPATT